jgi:hypothetical protein
VRGFTLQATVNDIRQSLQSEVGKFIHNYDSLAARTWNNGDVLAAADAMRDCIAGLIHWLYEGEHHFGKQYEEVAKFGWVFMDTGGTGTSSSGLEVL